MKENQQWVVRRWSLSDFEQSCANKNLTTTTPSNRYQGNYTEKGPRDIIIWATGMFKHLLLYFLDFYYYFQVLHYKDYMEWLRWAGVDEILHANSKFSFYFFFFFFILTTTTNGYYSYTEDSGWLRWAWVDEISPSKSSFFFFVLFLF